ncbi:MAG: ferritin family protein [Betaproteobacteria bacterium]|jgi:rubrerythrin|nr:ferritin family protein [Betaproteobacteria bacterium]
MTADAASSLDAFFAAAIAMEEEAAQRYEEFADAMDTHNNAEVASMFRRLAAVEARHADELMAQRGWTALPLMPRIEFEGCEGPETTPADAVHYLMTPWHALSLALANEERAVRFFEQLARSTTDETVRRAALEFKAEEEEHVVLVREWMGRVEKPPVDWAVDPDPPRYTD